MVSIKCFNHNRIKLGINNEVFWKIDEYLKINQHTLKKNPVVTEKVLMEIRPYFELN